MWKVGHRGAAGHVPENTLASFAKALEMGVDALECDLHVCASGETMVIHDATLDRTTNGKGRVSEKTLAELKQLDAGGGERIPTFQELLDFAAGRVPVFVELKSEDSAIPAVEVIARAVAAKQWDYAMLPVVSFNHPLLMEVKRLDPKIEIGAIMEGIPVDYASGTAAMGATWINPGIGFLNETLVNDAHARGLKVCTWTCNNPDSIAKAKRLNVDAIIGDFPERL